MSKKLELVDGDLYFTSRPKKYFFFTPTEITH